jgi:predicted membrane-bound dolichyl-phosphate-mannose-protein mannosyltransferase
LKLRFLGLSLADNYDRFFLVLFGISVALRLLWLDVPSGYGTGGALIFDEFFYVNAARAILGWQQGPDPNNVPFPGAVRGMDPNPGHPPLAKLMMAGSMLLLGNNAWGWRLPSVIMGSISLLFFYPLLKKMGASGKMALLSTYLMSFDALIFVDSRVAILDIFTLGFMVLGFYLYVTGRNRLSAITLALGTLCKIIGVYGFLVVVAYHFVSSLRKEKMAVSKSVLLADLQWFFRFGYYYALTGFVALLALSSVTGYKNPADYVQFMFGNMLALAEVGAGGISSQPLQWLMNQVQIPYLQIGLEIGSTYISPVAFWGGMNPFIIYLTIPAIAYAGYRYAARNSQVALFLLCWFAMTYLPYFPLAYIYHRISYLFYFQNTVPAVAGSIALMLDNDRLPKTPVILYILLVFVGFSWYFPFKKIPP